MKHVVSLSSILFCLILTGCGSTGNGDSGGEETGDGESSGTETSEDAETGDVETTEAQVVLNEIVADNPHGADWIELHNAGENAVSLSGWALTDSDPEHLESLPATLSIPSGGHVVLVKGTDFAFGIGKEDTVKLIGAGGLVADETTWLDGEVIEGTSWGRFPNGTGPFQTLAFPTPGSANTVEGEAECGNNIIEGAEICDNAQLSNEDCTDFGFMEGTLACSEDCTAFILDGCVLPDSEVIINEVTSSETDFIELKNVSEADVDVSGWMLTDNNPEAEGHIHTLPAESLLEAGAFLLLEKEGGHALSLGNKDSVHLRDSSGFLMDTTTWSSGDAAISWCRTPDGAGPFGVCAEATPGASND